MSDKNIMLISFILILAIISIPAVMAENTEEININYNQDFDDLMIVDNANLDNQYSINQDDLSDNSLPDWNVADTVSDEEGAFLEDDGVSEIDLGEKESKYPNLGANNLQSTITVDGKAYNQMVNRTIQNAIDSANEGDTINITGKEYSHCHFVVNKRLTIISEVGTVMSPCPGNTNGSGTHGLFYISPEASGTVLMGFSLINDLELKNDYCIYIKGTSDVEIINCTIINTTTLATDIEGYVGTTPVKVYIKAGKVLKVEALENEETPKYFDMVVKGLMKKWNGLPVKTAEKQKVDVVTGATVSSEAVIENVRRGISYYNYMNKK